MTELAVGDYAPIAEGIYLEGLSYDFARDVIWYSDVIKGGIYGVTPKGEEVDAFNQDRMWTGGVMMNGCGAILSSGERGIKWNNPDTGKSVWLLQEIDGQPINGVNEMVPDGTGGIFFGTNDLEMIIAGKPPRPTALYRLTRDRKIIKLADGLNFTNGMAYDAARRRYYCSDSFACAWRWDVGEDLTLSNKQMLLDRDDCDGMALDTQGNIWIAGFASPDIIRRIGPDGAALSPIATPAGCTTQVRFGGADMRDVYINIVPSDSGEKLKEGKPLSDASVLYRGRAAVAGLPVGPADFDLS